MKPCFTVPCATALTLTITASATFHGGNTWGPLFILRQALPSLSDALRASVSADGRFVAFASNARLLPADSNVVDDIYVLDRLQETVTLESRLANGLASKGSSGHPGISADGRYLVFDSDATNLVEEPDGNTSRDVFVRDRLSGTTRRISVSALGAEANGRSYNPAISADGRVVVFASSATNLVAEPDANGHANDVYLVRLASREISRISVGSDGHHPSTGQSFAPSLSGDGSVIVFTSTAIFTGSTSSTKQPAAVFMRDLTSGMTSCVSCSSHRPAFGPHVSGDGRFVVFTSEAASGPAPRRTDIVVYDRTSSVVSGITGRANASSEQPQISADGWFVIFQSQASNLECRQRCRPEASDENLLPDIYRFDLQAGQFRRVSGTPTTWWAPSVSPSVDATGNVIAFSSRQPLSPEDMTFDFDLFIRALDEATPAARYPK
jgi:Tol biopolymer transport system component